MSLNKFESDCNEKLSSLGISSFFNDTQWKFKESATSLNFDSIPNAFPSGVVSQRYDMELTINNASFFKLILLGTQQNSIERIKNNYSAIFSLFSALEEMETQAFTQEAFMKASCSLLSHSFSEGYSVKRIVTPNYKTSLARISLIATVLPELKLLHRLQFENFTMDNASITGIFDDACEAIMGISLVDFKEHGSFNFLGLDVGRYYIDYCGKKHDDHYAYAYAARRVLSDPIFNAELIDLDFENRGQLFTSHQSKSKRSEKSLDSLAVKLRSMATQTLMGIGYEDYTFAHVSQHKPIQRRKSAHELTTRYFVKYYNEAQTKWSQISLSSIQKVAEELDVERNIEQVHEILRCLNFLKLYCENETKAREKVWRDFVHKSPENEELFSSVSLSDLDALFNKHAPEDIDVINALSIAGEHFGSLKAETGSSSIRDRQLLDKVCKDVEDAGTVLIVAYTGWRASEFDFSTDNIKYEENLDMLDMKHIPFRFFLNWFVPKTHGILKVDRELTSTTTLLAKAQADLVKSDGKIHSYTRSNEGFATAVKSNWLGFVNHYELFTELDKLELLSAVTKELNTQQAIELQKLSERYSTKSAVTRQLVKLKHRLRDELPRHSIFDTKLRAKRPNTILSSFFLNTLDKDTASVLNKYIDEETLATLREEYKTKKSFSALSLKSVAKMVTKDCVYPTPHAFRHIWAEAVLLRYRGDVGAFIRANFKHIDERFFAAYLKDKELKLIHNHAERTVINLVVRSHLMDAQSGSIMHAGKFNRYITKACSKTNVFSDEDLEKLNNAIATTIVSVKSNPFITCVPRVGTMRIAKCSEHGELRRHLASPSICLGCVNSDFTPDNVDGLLSFIKYDVEVCVNEHLPAEYKEPHVQTLRNAVKVLSDLSRNMQTMKYNKIIMYLDSAISRGTDFSPASKGKMA